MSQNNIISNTKFVFLIPVYNSEKTIKKTIMSVIAQSYENWRIIVRNDMSTDNTFGVVDKLRKQFELEDKIQIINTTEKHGEVRNTLEAAKEIDDDEVICRLDGGDWLTELDCLAFLNYVYQTQDPACLWTAHRWAYTGKNISGPLPENCTNVYESLLDNWCTSHMKTWRKKSMNEINDANYRDENGDYIMIACDRAIYLPILHKAMKESKKCMFLPLCCYHYSIDLAKPDLFTEDRSVNQRKSAEFIHNRGYID
jgi:glycosyltransferase involved in cell wall biosynthesis